MWTALRLNIPTELTTAFQTVATALDAVKSAVEASRTVVQTANTQFQSLVGGTVDATSLGLSALLTATRGLLNSVTDDTGLYVLLIPLPKLGLSSVLSRPNTPDEPGSNYVRAPTESILRRLSLSKASELRDSPSFAGIFQEGASVNLGGNAYLVRTILESLFDSGDLNRPRFETTSHWAYALAVTGAEDLSVVIPSMRQLDAIFNTSTNANSLGTGRGIYNIVPRNVSARPSGRGTGVTLEWDSVPASRVLASFDRSRVVATDYAIIRSTDFRTMTATSVLELFGTSNLVAGLRGQYGSEVLAVRPYDGFVNRYLDESPLPTEVSVYYHVAFKARVDGSLDDPSTRSFLDEVRVRPPQNNSARVIPLPYDALSSCAEYRIKRRNDTRLSVAPDWRRTPSLARLIPGLNTVIDRVSERLEILEQVTNRANEYSTAVLRLIDTKVAQYNRIVSELTTYLNRLNALSVAPATGLFATVRQGQGNVGEFVSDLVTAFDDPNDENAPPFRTGDEYTVGVVLLAVGPDPSAIATAFNGLLALFGPSGTTNPELAETLAGIESIPGGVSALNEEALSNLRAAISSLAPSIAFDASMAPRAPGEPDASCEGE